MADPCCDQFGGEHEYGTRAIANGSFIFAVEKKTTCFSIRWGEKKIKTKTHHSGSPLKYAYKKDELGILPRVVDLLFGTVLYFHFPKLVSCSAPHGRHFKTPSLNLQLAAQNIET